MRPPAVAFVPVLPPAAAAHTRRQRRWRCESARKAVSRPVHFLIPKSGFTIEFMMPFFPRFFFLSPTAPLKHASGVKRAAVPFQRCDDVRGGPLGSSRRRSHSAATPRRLAPHSNSQRNPCNNFAADPYQQCTLRLSSACSLSSSGRAKSPSLRNN
jgi:hypothetical protein